MNTCLAYGADTSVNIEIKGTFSLNEKINFKYEIASDNNQEISFIPYVTCPTAPLKPMEKMTATISPEKPYLGTYDYLTVKEFIKPQTCTAYVEITSPVQLREEKAFKIETLPALDFEINTCKNAECNEKTKIFKKGETVYLDINSSITNPRIDANLELPDKTTKQILLPYSFKAEQPGTYNLTVTASKEGYRPTEQSIQFGVIEKEPEIPQAKEEEIPFTVKACEEEKWIEPPPASDLKKTCIEPKTEFKTGQKVKIYAELKDNTTATIKAKITYPNKTTKTLTLPTTLELKQKGTYIIEATAEKTGWKKTTKITTIKAREAAKRPSEEQPANFTLIAAGIIAVLAILVVVILVKLKKQ